MGVQLIAPNQQMFCSKILAASTNTVDINKSTVEFIEAFILDLIATDTTVGFVSGGHLQNEKGDLYTNRPAMEALFEAIHSIRCSRNGKRVQGLKLYLLSNKTRKVVDEGVLSRSGFPADLMVWDPSMVERVEGSVTVTHSRIVWADMNFDFSNFQGHTLARPLSHYVTEETITEFFSHLPRQLFERKGFNCEFVIQCMGKPAKCLEFPADISTASGLAQFVNNCTSVGFEFEVKTAEQIASGEKHRLYDQEYDSNETFVRGTTTLTLQRMFESTDSKEFKKYGNALNFHPSYFEDMDGKHSVAHGSPFPLGEIDLVHPLGLNAKVQALAYLLRMDEDPAFAAFCEKLVSLEVQICENAGHFRKNDNGAFIYDDTKFGGGFGCQVGPDQEYTKHGKPVVPYHAMGHGYSIACSLFSSDITFLGDRATLNTILCGAATRKEAISNLIVDIFSPVVKAV